MNNNTITVVTITFNNFFELKKTLESLSSIKGISSLVINGGKCPDTLKYLKENNILHISEPDQGISDAFSKGAKNAPTNYVAFLNSGDILIDQNYYQSALEIFQNDENIDFIYAKIEIDHVKHGKMIVTPNDQLNFTKMPYPHPSLIVRKKVFEKIGYFDLNLKVAMDYDFAIRLINSGCKGYFYQHNSVVLMDGTGVSSHQGINGQKERIAILKKYQRLNSQALIYQYKLLFKVYARKTLSILGFIQCYDKCKKKFFDIKPE